MNHTPCVLFCPVDNVYLFPMPGEDSIYVEEKDDHYGNYQE